MNTVEKQILHDFPDLRHKPIASTWKTETVSWSAIDKVENKAQETKIVYVKPSTNSTKTTYSPKISTILPDIIKKEINWVIQDSNWVNNTTLTWNIQEQEINTWVTTNEENVIKTEIKIEEPKKIEWNQSINYFWIIGAIIVLIIWFRLILKKTKRK
jgi:dipeptide/tripeptide permease